MKRAILIVIVLAAFAMTAAAHDYAPGREQERPILLQGGDLYTVGNGVMAETDLLFEDGVITRMGRDLEAPEDAEVIDVSGKRIYPGLIAARTTLGLIEISAVRATNDQNEVGDLNPEVISHISFNPDSELIPTVRSNGVTTVQVAPTGNLIRGRSFITHLDGWTKEDSAVRIEDGLHLDWPSVAVINAWWMSLTEEEQVERMATARKELKRFFDEAVAYAKAKDAGLLEGTDVRMEAMIPYVRGELSIYIEANDERQIREAIAFARERSLRIVIVGGDEADRVADLLAREEIPVILDAIQALPSREGDPYDQAFTIPARLAEAGVQFAITDPGSWSARDLPLQAAQAVAFGLSADDALRAITLSAAEILGIDETQGSLEVGKHATIVVSEGDILDTLTHGVTHMWIDGRRVNLNDKQKELFRKYREKIIRAREKK